MTPEQSQDGVTDAEVEAAIEACEKHGLQFVSSAFRGIGLAAILRALLRERRAAQVAVPSDTSADVDEIVTRLYRRFKEWSKRGFGPDDVTWCEVKADVVAMIAAQVAVPEGWEGPLTDEEKALIDGAWEKHNAAAPVARIINDNQPGKTAIVEILKNPPTLGVGTLLFSAPPPPATEQAP